MEGSDVREEWLSTSDGLRLDARVQGPQTPDSMVVWCHPHPLMGGTMFAPLMESVASSLSAAGVGVLRFDFRGVGRSTGEHGQGTAEVADVAAAVSRASELAPNVVVAGWSFGALVALRFVMSDAGGHHYVGVAPPISDPAEFVRADGSRIAFVVATRDQAVDNSKVADLAALIGAPVVSVETDHLFIGRSAPVVAAILEACETES